MSLSIELRLESRAFSDITSLFLYFVYFYILDLGEFLYSIGIFFKINYNYN